MNDIQHIDLLIVGSGPAGTSTALHLLDQDPSWAERMVIVDKAIHPREKLCGGGVTHLGENVLADLGLHFEPTNFAVEEVRLTYQEKSYSFYGKPVFRIVHRAEFDHWLVQQVENRGGVVQQGTAVLDVHPKTDHVIVETDAGTYRAKVLIAADGSRSLIRRKLGWNDGSHVARLIEVLTPDNEETAWEMRDKVAVFDFTHNTSDDLQGYYWDFPSVVNGELQMNRGVFDSRARPERNKANLKHVLGDALDQRERDLDDYTIKGHPIRWMDLRGRFSQPHILLAGDAAGADPLFGEGIGMALAYGRVAAKSVRRAFAKNDFAFGDYKRRVFLDPVLLTVWIRVLLARVAYRVESPGVWRLGWRFMKRILHWTPWANRAFVPQKPVRKRSAS